MEIIKEVEKCDSKLDKYLDISSNDNIILKSKLEVKLNDLEKRHLAIKERESQAVGIFERKLRQIELEHKMEIQLRRQLRYEVNNLRKRLLETHQLYYDTLEENAKLHKEIDRLKFGLLEQPTGNSRDISLSKIDSVDDKQEHFNRLELKNPEDKTIFEKGEVYNIYKELLEGTDDNKIIKDFIEFKDKKVSNRDVNKTINIDKEVKEVEKIELCNKAIEQKQKQKQKPRVHNIYKLDEKDEISPQINFGKQFNIAKVPTLRSERAQDWLKQLEALYSPNESPKGDILIPNYLSENKKEFSWDIPIEKKEINVNKLSTQSTHDEIEYAETMLDNTDIIINQISHKDKQLSTLLNQTLKMQEILGQNNMDYNNEINIFRKTSSFYNDYSNSKKSDWNHKFIIKR
ncbi:uncharacterized protein CMU_030910 [Cryptosporidium muris RN66]|uniref:Uncharacterized protein n=1 Tax=Cryptosporidium muris (strain RN66) TaxID=441375 RepID=B6AIA9_CRYMR|nr:uncharacterized protein CMU_030910 [Cryptosporidium muris RN66]EEA07950.1 hypothetical protein, conserved [Cryptosporidium muris RN66]|eukprot:XP_002142299.1 hypothetical protein [Cryptosporidium muris RN66]